MALKRSFIGPAGLGLLVSLGMIAFYLGIMTLTSDWFYATVQFEEYRWWIMALALGLGIQTALFVYAKRELRERQRGAGSLAVSGGVSTASMVVCCLHHVADFLPILGLPVLAAVFQQYQTLFFAAGLLSSLYGIVMMIRMLARHGLLGGAPDLPSTGQLIP
jgi:hypothetical protein